MRADYQRAIAKVVGAHRRSRKWTREDLARETGLDDGYLGEIERGRKLITFPVLELLAKAFDCSPTAFFKRIWSVVENDRIKTQGDDK